MSKVESVTPPPDNNELSSLSTMDSQSNGHGLFSKSRNARAQARHRAKRKAYIEQVLIFFQLHFYFTKDTQLCKLLVRRVSHQTAIDSCYSRMPCYGTIGVPYG